MPNNELKGDITLAQFLESVASGSATPEGGSVSALAGSLGSALVEMVVNLTLAKKTFKGNEKELQKIRDEARSCREALTTVIAKDIQAFQELTNAYLLPKTTQEEEKKRKEEIQKALRRAADPPLFTAVTSLKVLQLCQESIEKGFSNMTSDLTIGTLLADAGLCGGSVIVLIHLAALDDKDAVEKMRKELTRLKKEGEKIKKRIFALLPPSFDLK